MPTATVEQICKIAKLWEDQFKAARAAKPKQKADRNARKNKRKKKRKKRPRPDDSKSTLDKMKEVKALSLWGSDTGGTQSSKKNFAVPTPVDGS